MSETSSKVKVKMEMKIKTEKNTDASYVKEEAKIKFEFKKIKSEDPEVRIGQLSEYCIKVNDSITPKPLSGPIS